MNNNLPHRPLPLVSAQGDNALCGRMIAQHCHDRVARSLATYHKIFALCDITWAAAIKMASLHLPVIKEFTPHLLDELHGLAEGCGAEVNMDSLLALNCRTEILPPDFLLRAMATGDDRVCPGDTHANECTSLAIARSNAPVWLAQNWDWVGLQREALIVLQVSPLNKPAMITVTEAGMLAKIGVNDKGFGVSLNILRSNDDGKTPGMPVHFLLRALLECEHVEEACELALRLPYASSSNILIADASGNIASLEISPRGCRVLPAVNGQLCHTNHFLNQDFATQDAGVKGNLSTLNRLSTAQQRLSAVHDFADIKSLLSDTTDGLDSICRFPNQSLAEIAQIETVVGVVINLTEQSLRVSAAQPSITDFTEHRLNT